MLPIENSLIGSVTTTYDCSKRHSATVRCT